MGTMSNFCEDGSEQLGNCHVLLSLRVRQQPAVAPRWNQFGSTPTLPSAVRTPNPNTSWSQTPANERGTAATRTTLRPATAPGKRRSNYWRCQTHELQCTVQVFSWTAVTLGDVLLLCFHQSTVYSHVLHNDVSVNDGPHIRPWSHYNLIL